MKNLISQLTKGAAFAAILFAGSIAQAAVVANISSPGDFTTFKAGDVIDYKASAVATSGHGITDDSYRWDFVLHYENGTQNAPTKTGWAGTLTVPVDPNGMGRLMFIDFNLLVTFENEFDFKSVTVNGMNTGIQLNSDPAGATITVDGGKSYVAPSNLKTLMNSVRTVTAQENFSIGEKNYVFKSWSDGGARSHNVTSPSSGNSLELTANYRQVVPALVADIDAPVVGTTFKAGDTISYKASSIDVTGDPIPENKYQWEIVFNYENGPSSPLSTVGSQGNVLMSGAPTTLGRLISVDFKLTAIGQQQTVTKTVTLNADTANITLDTIPSGLTVAINGKNLTQTPFTVQSFAGSLRTVMANPTLSVNGDTYKFNSWSDGGAATHDVTTPLSGTLSLTATYDKTYLLTVTSGSGTGYYANGELAPIKADEPEPGFAFDKWEGQVINPLAAETFAQSRSIPTFVKATYKAVPSVKAKIDSPVAGQLFKAGEVLTFKASGTDLNNNPLADNAFSWNIKLNYEQGVEAGPTPSGAEGQFTVPKAPSTKGRLMSIEFTMFYQSENGQKSRTLTIDGQTTTINFDSVPSGISIGLNGSTPVVTLGSAKVLVDSIRTVSAPAAATVNNKVYEFVKWSDNGAASHDITIPNGPSTLIATYQEQISSLQAEITAPLASQTLKAGDVIVFKATSTDVDHKAIPDGQYHWDFNLFYEKATATLPSATGPQGQIVVPNQPAAAGSLLSIEFVMTATGQSNTVVKKSVVLKAALAQITLLSDPTGIVLGLNGIPSHETPFSTSSLVNSLRTVSASTQTTLNNKTYKFIGWSDNGEATHNVLTPISGTLTLTANYGEAFLLTVTSGTGSGYYFNGEPVAITADAPEPGMAFDKWEGQVIDPNSAQTIVQMRSIPLTVRAIYKRVSYKLTVTSGTGSGFYAAGSKVNNISPDQPESGMMFDRWVGDTDVIIATDGNIISVQIPERDVMLKATYKTAPNQPKYELRVTSGTGDGFYTEGTVVNNIEPEIPTGMAFDRWTGDTSVITATIGNSVNIKMPARNVTLIATFKPAPIGTTFDIQLSKTEFRPEEGKLRITMNIPRAATVALIIRTKGGSQPTRLPVYAAQLLEASQETYEWSGFVFNEETIEHHVLPSGTYFATLYEMNNGEVIVAEKSFELIWPTAPSPAPVLQEGFDPVFRPESGLQIPVAVTGTQHVKIDVYQLDGQHIDNICDTDLTSSDPFPTWDGLNSDNAKVVTGAYGLVINVDGNVTKKKISVIR